MEIRESEGRQASASPLTGLMHRWLECNDSQEASSALARALSLQGSGDLAAGCDRGCNQPFQRHAERAQPAGSQAGADRGTPGGSSARRTRGATLHGWDAEWSVR